MLCPGPVLRVVIWHRFLRPFKFALQLRDFYDMAL